MKKDRMSGVIFHILAKYFTFFLIVAFVTTCCLMLFVTALAESPGIELNGENISVAAKLTLVNVLLISLIFTVIDTIRQRYTVDRPVRQITEAAERMIRGDFSVRIQPVSRFAADDTFNRVIECINKMAEELSGVETLRNDFVANVSHEMKTPLAVIKNYARLFESENVGERERTEYATAICAATQRLSDMVTNILKLNRLENQKIYTKSEVYDLGEQLCECLLAYENVWEAKELEIDTDIAESIKVRADRELLSLVWNNLLSNAFKFTDRGRVSLKLVADGDFATVRIEDTGCGLSGDVGAHIFEKFYQADTSHKTEGNGLGLALVRRVVDITGGEISVESAIGVGTAFTVKIPRGLESV